VDVPEPAVLRAVSADEGALTAGDRRLAAAGFPPPAWAHWWVSLTARIMEPGFGGPDASDGWLATGRVRVVGRPWGRRLRGLARLGTEQACLAMADGGPVALVWGLERPDARPAPPLRCRGAVLGLHDEVWEGLGALLVAVDGADAAALRPWFERP
jgi:hypothetical protein